MEHAYTIEEELVITERADLVVRALHQEWSNLGAMLMPRLMSKKRINRWRNASLRRARQVVDALATTGVCDGWHFDAMRGARFIECVRRLDWSNGDTEEQREVLAWVKDHGQSLDWIFAVNPRF